MSGTIAAIRLRLADAIELGDTVPHSPILMSLVWLLHRRVATSIRIYVGHSCAMHTRQQPVGQGRDGRKSWTVTCSGWLMALAASALINLINKGVGFMALLVVLLLSSCIFLVLQMPRFLKASQLTRGLAGVEPWARATASALMWIGSAVFVNLYSAMLGYPGVVSAVIVGAGIAFAGWLRALPVGAPILPYAVRYHQWSALIAALLGMFGPSSWRTCAMLAAPFLLVSGMVALRRLGEVIDVLIWDTTNCLILLMASLGVALGVMLSSAMSEDFRVLIGVVVVIASLTAGLVGLVSHFQSWPLGAADAGDNPPTADSDNGSADVTVDGGEAREVGAAAENRVVSSIGGRTWGVVFYLFIIPITVYLACHGGSSRNAMSHDKMVLRRMAAFAFGVPFIVAATAVAAFLVIEGDVLGRIRAWFASQTSGKSARESEFES